MSSIEASRRSLGGRLNWSHISGGNVNVEGMCVGYCMTENLV